MIYQSQSGDAADGTSEFTMSGGSLTSKNGHVFHVTNTSAVISLDNTDIVNGDEENVLLSVCDDGWSGASNTAVMNANDQELSGAILVGDNSSLTLNLTGATTYSGYTGGKITNGKGSSVSTTAGAINVTMTGGEALWVLTADSVVSSVSGSGKINYNGHTLTVGDASYTSGSPAEGITESSDTASSGQKSDITDPSDSGESTSDSGSTETASSNSATLVAKDKSLNIASVMNPSGIKKVKYYVVNGDKRVASVNKKGEVKAKKAGSVTYGVRFKNGRTWSEGSGTYTIKVEKPVTVRKKSLATGESIAVSSLYDSASTSFSPEKTTSSNPQVASVENGSIKALSAGRAKISYYLGGVKFQSAITVK